MWFSGRDICSVCHTLNTVRWCPNSYRVCSREACLVTLLAAQIYIGTTVRRSFHHCDSSATNLSVQQFGKYSSNATSATICKYNKSGTILLVRRIKHRSASATISSTVLLRRRLYAHYSITTRMHPTLTSVSLISHT
jgi:hypothetical protein